jgi:hypothetical protein
MPQSESHILSSFTDPSGQYYPCGAIKSLERDDSRPIHCLYVLTTELLCKESRKAFLYLISRIEMINAMDCPQISLYIYSQTQDRERSCTLTHVLLFFRSVCFGTRNAQLPTAEYTSTLAITMLLISLNILSYRCIPILSYRGIFAHDSPFSILFCHYSVC